MTRPGTLSRPLRVAIVGSGPAGFFTAERLFKSGIAVRVDMFERLPTPYGLLRGGVAPDQPKIKSLSRVFDRIAAHEGFAFFGNVTVGRDIALCDLRRFYDAIIFAAGMEHDPELGIPGEDLPGCHSAFSFVAWYNGHPDFRHLTFDLSSETAVVIGHGNVATDVTRILLSPIDSLRKTDMPRHALDALEQSNIRKVHIIGRRGPVQAKFTHQELRLIDQLPNCSLKVRGDELELAPASQAALQSEDTWESAGNLKYLRACASRSATSTQKECWIRFMRGPVEIRGKEFVQSVVFERTRLIGPARDLRAEGTGEWETIACGLILVSIGHRGAPIEGVPFDESTGALPHEAGRVTGMPGCYAVGWIKRGARGIIGTNKPDSAETVASLLEDLDDLSPCPTPDSEAVKTLLARRGVRVITFADWQRIQAAETARGATLGKPSEKLTTHEEIWDILRDADPEVGDN